MYININFGGWWSGFVVLSWVGRLSVFRGKWLWRFL